MPKGLQETTSIIQPSYITTTPWGTEYIDISKPGGFAALAQQSGVKQESILKKELLELKKCQMDLK